MDEENVNIKNYEKTEDSKKNKIKSHINDNIKISTNVVSHQSKVLSNNEKKNKILNSSTAIILRSYKNVEYDKSSVSNKVINFREKKSELKNFSKEESNIKNNVEEKNTKHNIIMKHNNLLNNYSKLSKKFNYSSNNNNNEHLLYNKNEKIKKHYSDSGNINRIISNNPINYKNNSNLKENKNHFDINRKRKIDVEEKLRNEKNIHNYKFKKYDHTNFKPYDNFNIIANSTEISNSMNSENLKDNNNCNYEKIGMLQNNIDEVNKRKINKGSFVPLNRFLSDDKENEENLESKNIKSNIKYQRNNETYNENQDKKTEVEYNNNSLKNYINSNSLKYIKNVYDYDDEKYRESKYIENDTSLFNTNQRNEENAKGNKKISNEEKCNYAKKNIMKEESLNVMNDIHFENKNKYKKQTDLNSELLVEDIINSRMNVIDKKDSYIEKGYIQEYEVSGNHEILKKKNGNIEEGNYLSDNCINLKKNNENSQRNHYIHNASNHNKNSSVDNLKDMNNINNNVISNEQFMKTICLDNSVSNKKKLSNELSSNIYESVNSNNLNEKSKFKEINIKKDKFNNYMEQENRNTSIYTENSYNMNKEYSQKNININKKKECMNADDSNNRNNEINNKKIDEKMDTHTNTNFEKYFEIDSDNSTNKKDSGNATYNLNNDKFNKCISQDNMKKFNSSKITCNSSNEYESCNYNKIHFSKNEDKEDLSKITSKMKNSICNTNTENNYEEKKNYKHINIFNEIQNKYKQKLVEENFNILKNENVDKGIHNMDLCDSKELTTIDNGNLPVSLYKKNKSNNNVENEKGLLKKGTILTNKKILDINSEQNDFDDINNKREALINKYKNSSSHIYSSTNLFHNKKINTSELKTIKKDFKENHKKKILQSNKINYLPKSNIYSNKIYRSKLCNNANNKYMHSRNNNKNNNSSSSFISKFNKKIDDVNISTSISSNRNRELKTDTYKKKYDFCIKNNSKIIPTNKNIGIYSKQNLSNLHLEKNSKNVDITINKEEGKEFNNCEMGNNIIKLKSQNIVSTGETSKEIKSENLNGNEISIEESGKDNLDNGEIRNEEINEENVIDNIKSKEKVKNKDILDNSERIKNEKHVHINKYKNIENNLIKKKGTNNEKISSSGISANSSKSLKGNINLKSKNAVNVRNTDRWIITSANNIKLGSNMDKYKNKKNIHENSSNTSNQNNTYISDASEINKNKHIVSTTVKTNTNNYIKGKTKLNMQYNKGSHIKKLNTVNREKGNYIEERKKNIYDYENKKYLNNYMKDVINEEMEKYKISKKYKLRSNSIPPSTQNNNNNGNNLLIKNGKQVDNINKNGKINKNAILKKQSNSCDNANKSIKKIKSGISDKKDSNNSGNNEKKEISYFEWLAKEKTKNEEEIERQKKNKINNILNEKEENLMLQPLSAFNLKQNNKIYEQDDFIVDKHPIGNGRTGLVFKAIIKKENEKVALKVMAKDTIITLNIERQVLKEIIIQASLKHINILELIAYFEDKTRLFLILELANGGSIRNKMKLKSQPLEEEEVAFYVYQIADALSYLHKFNIIHRDLKPDNILIHYSDEYLDNKIYKYGIIKLADFGFSCQLKNKRQKRSTFCGTVDYMPPEIINQIPYDCNVDLWCLGIIIFELLVGFPPFTDDTQERIFDQIKELNFHFPKTVSLTAQELILKLCSKTSEERISAEEVKSHPWIKQFL